MLEIKGLRVAYGGNEVVHGVDIEVGRGTIACLLGSNGAGKSTTMRATCGLVRASAGAIALDGRPMRVGSAAQMLGAGLALVPEGRKVFAPLSVEENLQMGGYLMLRERRRADFEGRLDFVLGLFPRLRERSKQAAGTLSGGEQQMLGIGRALMSDPQVLLLDEPSMGLAPLVVRDIFATLARLRDEGMTLLIAEQNARAGLSIANEVFIMAGGCITKRGMAAEMSQDEGLFSSYLGTHATREARKRNPNIEAPSHAQ
jgi:branched-chain amino acid transport system ATP-binding protein